MPKLYFRYGTMNSSKTANLIMVAHNYKSRNRNVIVLKPAIDSRFSEECIVSRALGELKCNAILKKDDNVITVVMNVLKELSTSSSQNILHDLLYDTTIDCILVDECQFLTTTQVDELRKLTSNYPVICYGLRTNYKGYLFEGSKRLMELADSIEEVKTVCSNCNKKAIMNAKIVNGLIIKDGDKEIELGAEELYKPLCWNCWYF